MNECEQDRKNIMFMFAWSVMCHAAPRGWASNGRKRPFGFQPRLGRGLALG